MRKTVLLSFAAGLSLVLAAEFLGLVPNSAPEVLAGGYAVVGVTGNGVLVKGDDSSDGAFASLGGRFLAENPGAHRYYTVHLFAAASRADLAAVSRILDFDGEEYLVEVEPEAVERFIAVPAMRGRINLGGWVMDRPAPGLPPVLSDPAIEQIVARVSPDSVLAFVHHLQDHGNRYSTSDSCKAAAQWIAAEFRQYGCDTVILQDHTTNHAPNVIGVRYGTLGERGTYALIDGHFDAVSVSPGADDNASGTVSAIEACRVTQGFQFQHDLRFIAFSGEEQGLYGSTYYAGQAHGQGDTILGVLNFDMIAYADTDSEDLNIIGKIAAPSCEPFCDWFIAVADTYTTLPCHKDMVGDMQSSDQGPFWNNGYVGFCGIEDYWPTNPYYHTAGDSIGAGYNDNDFCTNVIRAGVAALATLGEPVGSGIRSDSPLSGRLTGAPRLALGKNPAVGNVRVYYSLPQATNVELAVYNRTGQMLATLASATKAAGTYAATWDTRTVPSGIYFLRLTTPESHQSAKAIVSR